MKTTCFTIDHDGLPTYTCAFTNQLGDLEVVPTVIFHQVVLNNNWSDDTTYKYALCVGIFFKTIASYHDNNGNKLTLNTVTNSDLKGFIQGYYNKKLPFQINKEVLVSENRMLIMTDILKKIFNKGAELGFCQDRLRSFTYKRERFKEPSQLDTEYIISSYINKDIFNVILEKVTTKSEFERSRDQLALKIAYETGVRTEELVRSSNFSIKRLKHARLKYIRGVGVEWSILGKGRDGGKNRNILIKPQLAETIFSFILKYENIYSTTDQLFSTQSGKVLSPQHGTRIFYKAINNLNDYYLKNLSFHKLRHTYATNLAIFCDIENINPRLIQDRLGHKDAKTTARYIDAAVVIKNNASRSHELRMTLAHSRGL